MEEPLVLRITKGFFLLWSIFFAAGLSLTLIVIAVHAIKGSHLPNSAYRNVAELLVFGCITFYVHRLLVNRQASHIRIAWKVGAFLCIIIPGATIHAGAELETPDVLDWCTLFAGSLLLRLSAPHLVEKEEEKPLIAQA